jgi:hypothetical protein
MSALDSTSSGSTVDSDRFAPAGNQYGAHRRRSTRPAAKKALTKLTRDVRQMDRHSIRLYASGPRKFGDRPDKMSQWKLTVTPVHRDGLPVCAMLHVGWYDAPDPVDCWEAAKLKPRHRWNDIVKDIPIEWHDAPMDARLVALPKSLFTSFADIAIERKADGKGGVLHLTYGAPLLADGVLYKTQDLTQDELLGFT